MNKTFDRYSSILFALIGAFFVVGSKTISTSAYGSQVGPNMFPLGLGIVLILLSFRLFYETTKYSSNQVTAEKLNHKRFLTMIGITIIYIILLEPVGYVISTFLFLVAAFRIMDSKTWWKTVLIAAAFSVGVYYIYVEILQGTLPDFPVWLDW